MFRWSNSKWHWQHGTGLCLGTPHVFVFYQPRSAIRNQVLFWFLEQIRSSFQAHPSGTLSGSFSVSLSLSYESLVPLISADKLPGPGAALEFKCVMVFGAVGVISWSSSPGSKKKKTRLVGRQANTRQKWSLESVRLGRRLLTPSVADWMTWALLPPTSPKSNVHHTYAVITVGPLNWTPQRIKRRLYDNLPLAVSVESTGYDAATLEWEWEKYLS